MKLELTPLLREAMILTLNNSSDTTAPHVFPSPPSVVYTLLPSVPQEAAAGIETTITEDKCIRLHLRLLFKLGMLSCTHDTRSCIIFTQLVLAACFSFESYFALSCVFSFLFCCMATAFVNWSGLVHSVVCGIEERKLAINQALR